MFISISTLIVLYIVFGSPLKDLEALFGAVGAVFDVGFAGAEKLRKVKGIHVAMAFMVFAGLFALIFP